MYCEPSSGIKLTAYNCICWLFHRIEYKNGFSTLANIVENLRNLVNDLTKRDQGQETGWVGITVTLSKRTLT